MYLVSTRIVTVRLHGDKQ